MLNLLGLGALLAAGGTLAQEAAKPAACQGVEARQFDFWIGRWEVFAPDGRKAGDNVIESIDGGCALIERWTGRGGFTGTSLNSWDAGAKLWRQHWVDNQGGLLRLAGRFEAGSMVLGASEPHPDKPGATRRQRIRWTPLPDGAVRQLWEQSDDDGATWTVAFDGRYVRPRP
jgi:hypothetical protein